MNCRSCKYKRWFRSRSHAKRVSRVFQGKVVMSPYKCAMCGGWHLTSSPMPVIGVYDYTADCFRAKRMEVASDVEAKHAVH